MEEKRKRDHLGYVLIGSSLVLAAICGTAVAAFQPTEINERNGCPVGNKAPQAHTVILVDQTDRFSTDELKYARSLIRTEYLWLPIGGRLTVRSIVADPDQASDIVICRISDGSDTLGVMVNPARMERDFQRIAGSKLDELSEALKTAPAQDASPILEYASRVMDRPDFGAGVKTRRLVIISDFAQHSDLASDYGQGRALGREGRAELERDMSGLAVRLHYIRRAKLSLQGPAHKDYWRGHFNTLGARDLALGHDLLIGEEPDKETWIDESF